MTNDVTYKLKQQSQSKFQSTANMPPFYFTLCTMHNQYTLYGIIILYHPLALNIEH